MSIYSLIPLLPLAAALMLALSGERLEGRGHRLVIPAVTLSFLVSVYAFIKVAADGAVSIELYQLLDSGSLTVNLGFYIDQLTVLLLLLVTGVSMVVQVYASRYMVGDARHSRFFALTALFTAAMTILVMSSNLLLTFIFWEVMGICSYLLISHYSQRPQAARAATKVFLVNSIADVGLGIGVILTFRTFGTLDIPTILAMAQAGTEASTGSITLLTLCLFCGAIGKSAQMPAHVWLPFAMEAPTPVSALIHAATMVNAGPFLLVRLSPIVVLSPTTMTVIAIIGGVTALFAAVVSLTQTDIKRTLAYSTISQLGFMTFLCGVGAFVAAIFHLLAHGFFKAYLFLSTGNALAGTHRHLETHDDVRSSSGGGGLFAGGFVLSLIPVLIIFSGPYRYLWLSQGFTAANTALWIVSLGTIFITAMYLVRGLTAVFHRGPPGARDGDAVVAPMLFSGKHMGGIAFVLIIMITILVIVWQWLANFLSPAVAGLSTQSEMGYSLWALIPLAVAIAGWVIAYRQSLNARLPSMPQWRKRLYVFFLNKGYFDELYEVYLVRPTLGIADWMWKRVDQGIIDRLVILLGTASTGLARRLRILDSAVDNRVVSIGGGSVKAARWVGQFVDSKGISKTVEGIGRGVDLSGQTARRYEPHTLQHNLLVIVIWLVAALGFFYWIAG